MQLRAAHTRGAAASAQQSSVRFIGVAGLLGEVKAHAAVGDQLRGGGRDAVLCGDAFKCVAEASETVSVVVGVQLFLGVG
ncbi:hypothetical protein AWC17_26030 [Mycobacterium nebraskense]|uniref:Uncharacterized protein n=1 Tax=Mycobacterium nebraskense TaxID=244292 RepID=A0A1X1ZY65_9MYCO|nr:hypothetical protein AWC17_26030 [Mycobacterium nebraskense]